VTPQCRQIRGVVGIVETIFVWCDAYHRALPWSLGDLMIVRLGGDIH